MLPTEIIRHKRDGQALHADEIGDFAQGLADGRWSDAQAGALAMAILLRGMDGEETVALTAAMVRSGAVLDWSRADLPGPVLDKHSTGGVGDKVSLLLAPIVAACGGVVPMVSGRGLGHTGGTLDKLEALPGYGVNPSQARLCEVLQTAGCAIIGASEHLAPADRRLYAIRDVTATVESLPLITASILSKKLAAGLHSLVLDVKTGSGAFTPTRAEARALAQSLVRVARGAGLPACAMVTDMDQVLGHSAGNALEVQECLAMLRGEAGDPRLRELTLRLSGALLHLGGLAGSEAAGVLQATRALANGAAAERFARMVAALDGPADVMADARLPLAPVQRAVPALRSGVLARMDTRALGWVVVGLGGGRRHNGDAVDPRVGLQAVLPLGRAVQAGEALAVVHAGSEAAAADAVLAVQAALSIGDEAPPACDVVLERVLA